MAREDGVYVADNGVTEIPDGGSVRMEVFNENQNAATDTPLYTWPVSVQGGKFEIDIPQTTSVDYPDTSQFSIVATLPSGEKVRKLISGAQGGTILQRKGTLSVVRFITPQSGSRATTVNILFQWSGPTGAYYEIAAYYDDQLTVPATNTSGAILENDAVNAATTHTFEDTKPDELLYVALRWWPDSAKTGAPAVVRTQVTTADAAVDSRILSNTSISNVTGTSFLASISFTEGVKLRNYVDVMDPPVALYSTQNDFLTSEHASPISGLPEGSVRYIQQIAEFQNGDLVAGKSTRVQLAAVGETVPYFTGTSSTTTTDYLLVWNDSNPPADRNFRVMLDGVDVSGVLGNAIRQHQLTGLSDGTKSIDLRYFPAATPASYSSISKNITVGEAVQPPTSNVLRPTQYTSVQGGWNANANGVPAYQEQRTESSALFPAGTTIRRVSPAGQYHPYSKRAAINADSTMVVASGRIYRTSDGGNTGYTVGIGPRNEFNWSNVDPNLVMGIGNDGKSFVRRNVVTGSLTTLRTWSEYQWMSVGDFEGSQSNDDRYTVLIGHRDSNISGPRDHISIDTTNGNILGTLTANYEDDWASFSQDGQFLLVEGNSYGDTNPIYNMRFYDKNFNHLRTVNRKPEHGDWGVDYLGQQCYVMETGYGLNYVIAATGQLETICTSGMQWGHLSCRNIKRPGYCYHSNGDSGGAIIEAEIKPQSQSPKFALYGQHRSSAGANGYNYYAMGTPNQDASMVAYHSDYQQGGGDAGVFEMLLKLPPV